MVHNTEIERKFLVRSESWRKDAVERFDIQQGYLCKEAEKTIRVRIRDKRAFLTIKVVATDGSTDELWGIPTAS